MHYSVISGLLLKRQPLREADEILTVWSWERGKIRLVVRGLRRNRSRLKAAVLPLAWMEYRVVCGRGLPLVIGTRIVRSYGVITTEFGRAALVLALFELVLRLTADEASNQELSLLLRECLEYLEAEQRVGAAFFVKIRLQLLAVIGYRLLMSQCASCGSRLDQLEFSWSFLAMGPLCGNCASTAADIVKIDPALAAAVDALQRDSDLSVDADIAPPILRSIDHWLCRLFVHLTERPLQSPRLLYELAGNPSV